MIGGGVVDFVRPHLDGRGDAADATPLAPPSLLLSSSSSSAIAEVDVVGGVTSSVDADLDVVPATKEDVVDADDDGATVAAVIATPDTTGGDDAREAIVLALSSSTRHALIVLSLVMNTFFSSFNDVDLPHSMLVDCCMICCRECGPIATVVLTSFPVSVAIHNFLGQLWLFARRKVYVSHFIVPSLMIRYF